MPLAKSFGKDIFISYCHTDNEDPLGEGWVAPFHCILRLRLIQILDARVTEEEPSIWRNNRLQRSDEFADVLPEELRQVALVVSVLSPSYVKSDWCTREIDAFCRAAAERMGLKVGTKMRICSENAALLALKRGGDLEKQRRQFERPVHQAIVLAGINPCAAEALPANTAYLGFDNAQGGQAITLLAGMVGQHTQARLRKLPVRSCVSF